jgi:hypothetical protein
LEDVYREGAPKPKGKVRDPENLAPGAPKRWMENAIFFNIPASMGKRRKT